MKHIFSILVLIAASNASAAKILEVAPDGRRVFTPIVFNDKPVKLKLIMPNMTCVVSGHSKTKGALIDCTDKAGIGIHHGISCSVGKENPLASTQWKFSHGDGFYSYYAACDESQVDAAAAAQPKVDGK
jgi:hypothetical protein